MKNLKDFIQILGVTVLMALAFKVSAGVFYFGNNEAVNLTNQISMANGERISAGGVDLLGVGLALPVGSIYLKTDGTLWIKTGALNTDWGKASTSEVTNWAAATFYKSGALVVGADNQLYQATSAFTSNANINVDIDAGRFVIVSKTDLLVSYTDANVPTSMEFRRSRGTYTLPTNIVPGDDLGVLNFTAKNFSDGTFPSVAQISIDSTGVWDATQRPTLMQFSKTNDLLNAPTLVGEFDIDGAFHSIFGILSDTTIEAVGDILTTAGVIRIENVVTPVAIPGTAAIYPKVDNRMYYQDGVGVEHVIPYANTYPSVSATQKVYVNYVSGSDVTGDGSIFNPVKSVQHAYTLITDAAVTKPYTIYLGASQQIETGDVLMKPYTFIVGDMRRATYFRVNAGEVKPDPLFAANTGWIGLSNLDFGGITIFNLDFQTVGGASGAVFLLNDCINVGNFSMEGRAGGSGDSLELTSGLSSGTFTLDATTYHIQNWYFKSTMTFTNTLALVGLSGTILDIGVDGNISLTDQTAYWNNVIYGNSGNTLTTVGTVILQAGGNALPPVPRQALSVGTTVNYNYNNSTIPYAAAVPLDWAIVPTMTDTALDYLAANKIWKPTAIASQILGFNGVEWIAFDNNASVGQGVSFFLDDTPIIPTGVNNANPVNTLSKFPISTVEIADSASVTNSTVLMEAHLYNTALSGTSIEAGAWNFDTWAGVDNATGISQILTNIHKVSTPTGTITVTGAGASRTVNASAGTPFAVTNITASAVIDVASYLQTPTGLFQITARASDTQITIAVPVTYTNETTVAYSTWQRLFQVTTGEINNISPNYILYNIVSVQPSFTSDPTDKLAAIYFARTDSGLAKTLTYTHNGTNRYSHFETPIIIRHNDLAGLQGGNATERYHLTAAEYAAISAGIGITEASSLALAAGGTITPSAASFQQWLVASSGGAVTLNAAPFTLVDPLNAVEITLIGNSSTDTVTIVENDAVSGTLMNGNWTSSRGKIITFRFSTTLGRWVELSRSN